MEAIVLAGGFGTRLRQLVPDLPKPMAPIAGRPFLEILLHLFARKGFKRVILSLGFMEERISGYFGSQFEGMELSYVVESQPLGTGGAARLAMQQVQSNYIFIFNGDTFLDLDVKQVELQWLLQKKPIIIVRHVPDTFRYGRILIKNNIIKSFSEKGIHGPGLINAGSYLFRRGQLDRFELGRPFSLEQDYLSKTASLEKFGVFITEGQFIDIGIPQDFIRAQSELAKFRK